MAKNNKKEFNISGKFLEKKESEKKIESSDSGLTRHFTNDVTAEFDSCLQGQKGSRAFKIMARSDSIVGGILRSYENPIKSAQWAIEEIPNATPRELEVTEILNSWFFERNNFDILLNQILGMLPIGFSLFEKFFTMVEFEDGDKFMMPVLAERTQPSIRKIDYKELIVEQNTTDSNLINIPFNDLVFFTFRQEGNDRRGTSLLRQAYYDFLEKKEIKMAGKKGVIRSMIGLIVGTTPKEITIESQAFNDFVELIISLGERNFNGLSDSAVKQEGYQIEILNSKFDLDALREYVTYLDSAMLISVLTQFLLLGQGGNGGSYSLGKDQSGTLLDGMQGIITYIGRQFSQQIIYQTVTMNWSDVDPKKFNMIGTNLTKKNSKEFADTLKSLLDGGIIKVVPEDEVKIRKMYGLPEVDLKDIEDREEEKEIENETNNLEENINNEKENKENKQEKIKLSERNHFKTGKQRKVFKNREVEKLARFSRASLQLIADEFSKAIRRQLNKGEVEAQGLKDLHINNISAYKKRLSQKVSGIAMDAWKNALRNSKGKIKLAEIKASDLPTQVLTAYVLNQTDIMADKQVNDLREDAILMANTQASKGLSVNNTMALVDEKMDDYIASKNRIEFGADTSIVQAMNYGEMEYYNSIKNDLWGFLFANDEPVTQICKSLVGKTYQDGSSAMDVVQPPLHGRCDSFFIPIYKSEFETKPELDNFIPSDEILKQKTI